VILLRDLRFGLRCRLGELLGFRFALFFILSTGS